MARNIFVGHRALGFVSNHVPLTLRYIRRRKENLIVTVVGKCFHTYGSAGLNLLSTSGQLPDDINCIAGDAFLVYTACKNVVYAWKRGCELKHIYKENDSNIHLLLPFGHHLLSVDKENILRVWDIKSQELHLEMTFDKKSFLITALLHPSTYLNKILVGSEQGTLQLWNLHSAKQVYTFAGWGSGITVLEQAPAIDTIAAGLANGHIIIHNLKYDQTVMTFIQEWGPIVALSFRTDGPPILASASPVGHIGIWNLEQRRLQSQIREAHCGSVTGMKFLPNEPILVTSSPDNTLKEWIFDQPDDSGRLLHLREGHSKPPVLVQFYGNNGQNILSAGLDSTLRSFSTIGSNLNKNLGQASSNRKLAKKKGIKHDLRKLPPITNLALEVTREKEWDNIAACHRGHGLVTTWSYNLCKMGKHQILHERFRGHFGIIALCVALSSCGNFLLIGYSTGHVDRYNIQSGIHRGTYGEDRAHNGAVRGIATDGLNQVTITGGSDRVVKFWTFKGNKILSTVCLDSPVAKILLHKESAMVAVALDNFKVVIIDRETYQVVRNFPEHGNRITDMAFSPDGRWLVSSSMDCVIRTWDLPSGRLIDAFLVSSACTSLTMSPTGEYLATCHVDDLGVYLWANATLYSLVSIRPLPSDYQPKAVDLPTTSGISEDKCPEEAVDLPSDGDEEWPEFKSPEQISEELITLSLLPVSQWRNLLNLDVIKMRNKPKEPPKAPKAAPFFLPTLAGLMPQFASVETGSPEKKPKSQLTWNLHALSPFAEQLVNCGGDYTTVVTALKSMGPSAIDVEIRSLAPDSGGSPSLMAHFMQAMNQGLQSNQDFELIQSYLGLFLKVHSNTISEEPELQALAETLAKHQAAAWQRLQAKFSQSQCLVNYLKSAVI